MKYFPSLKELLAIVQIAIAVVCYMNYTKLELYDTPMYEIPMFEHQCVNMALGFVSLYYAFGTWLWYSNFAQTRMVARIHAILVYVILIVLLYLTRFRYYEDYGELLRGYLDHSVCEDEEERLESSFMLMHIIAGLAGITVLGQLYLVIRRIVVVIKVKRNQQPQ